MGYYSTFTFEILNAKVDLEKIKKIEKYFSDSENEHVYGFHEVTFGINEQSFLEDISLNEYYQTFYDSEYFAKKLSEAIVEGEVYLYFSGEDGYGWGYKVTSNNVDELKEVFLTEKEDNEFTLFKSYLNVLYELKNRDDDEIIVKTENGSGKYTLKLKKNTKVKEVKSALKYLFNDLAIDLGINVDRNDFNNIY